MIASEDMMRELRQTFSAEAAEHLQNLNMVVLALEIRPEEARRRELIQEGFRAAHSLKGAARTVGLESIEHLSHAMESVLQQARDTESHLDAGTCDALYDALDNIGFQLDGQTVEVESLIQRLNQGKKETNSETLPKDKPLVAEKPNGPKIEPSPAAPVVAEAPKPTLATREEPITKPVVNVAEESIRVSISKLDNLMAQVGELLVSRINAEQRLGELRSLRQQVADWSKAGREIKTLLPRVDEDVAAQLTEIVLRYEKQAVTTLQNITRFDQRAKQDTVRLGVITAQLQDNARHVRMVPFETIVPILQRTIRDAAHIENKQVIFEVVGVEVELDKKVLEVLKDPFIHMLRNAVSHGIETAPIRSSRGKSLEGHVTLTLQQRGSEVRISLEDDGGGFDLKALSRAGGKKADRADNEDGQAIIELAFMPGVTTTQEVTALSGRGVGLDVVRQRVEELQGHIEVDSVPGEGAHIHLIVPSSLTISRGLLVQIGDECYVLPLLSVIKIFVPEAESTFTVGGQTMLTVDGMTIPIVSLASLLRRPFELQDERNSFAVIMAVAEQRLVLLVDDVLTEQEIAMKPLGFPLRHAQNVAGAALMGDGRPVVVLNAADLVRAAKGTHQQTYFNRSTETIEEKTVTRILVVDDSITTRTLEKSILETAGYEVITATDGLQALQRLQEQPIDLVVSDVEMPNIDGISLTRKLREDIAYAYLPIILVTSLESKEDRERGMDAGANAYIVKRGFDQGELLRTIEQLVFIEED